jgi:hypothetical protein
MIALMQQGADAGYHFAQYRLAQTYLTGEGVPDEALEGLGLPNPVRALRYLAAAARSGNDEAARELAELYATGAPGLTPNPARQFRWTSFPGRQGRRARHGAHRVPLRTGHRHRARSGARRGRIRACAGNRWRRSSHDARDYRWRRAALGQETALAFQAILQARGLYTGALDAQVGPGTLGAARALAPQ